MEQFEITQTTISKNIEEKSGSWIFENPVEYLAGFGIEAVEVEPVVRLPEAA